MNQPKKAVQKQVRTGGLPALCLAGFFAGIANGLLGAGGGILAVFGLLWGCGSSLSPRDVYANALCVMLPLSAISCFRYAQAGNLELSGFAPFALPAILGGIVGAILLGRIDKRLLGKLFGGLVVWSGVMLIVR